MQADTSPFRTADFSDGSIPAAMRAVSDGQTLTLRAPRVGFFNTLPFQEQWQTNVDNQFRLNTNQTLIAALNLSFESGDPTEPHHLDGVDAEHAPAGSDCLGCHKNLDPMRNVFHNHFNPDNHRARRVAVDPVATNTRPDFAFQDHRTRITSMQDFAHALADHPNFAMAWTEKLCQWLSAMRCDRQSTEMQRIAKSFADTNYNLSALIKTLATSSLLTQTTFDADAIVPGSRITIARQNHYCAALMERLSHIRDFRQYPPLSDTRGIDLCFGSGNSIRLAASIIPADGVIRGQIPLVQSSANDMMLAKAYDAFCDRASTAVVGFNDHHTFQPDDAATALDDMTQFLLGIPTEASTYPAARSALQTLYDLGRASPACSDDAALSQSASGEITCGLALNRTNSLRLVWRTACQAPDLTGIGL